MVWAIRSIIKIECWDCGQIKSHPIDAKLRKMLSDGYTKPVCIICGSFNVNWDTMQNNRREKQENKDIHEYTRTISTILNYKRKKQ